MASDVSDILFACNFVHYVVVTVCCQQIAPTAIYVHIYTTYERDNIRHLFKIGLLIARSISAVLQRHKQNC